MAFKMKGFPKHAGVGGSPMNKNGDPKKEESEPGTLEKLGSKLDPYYEKVKKTVGKGVETVTEAHRKGLEKAKDIATGDIAKTGVLLGSPGLGIAGQIGKEIYEKVKGKGKGGSGAATSAKEATKTVKDKPKATKTVKPKGKGKGKGKLQKISFTPSPKQEFKKMEGKKATTISTPKTEKSIIKKGEGASLQGTKKKTTTTEKQQRREIRKKK
jgi:hypothetical protein